MVGLGGGFIAVPILLLFFGLKPAEASGTSLALVVANSAAGAFTYGLQRRIDLRIGLLIAAGGFPGAIIGAVVATRISATAFDWILGVMLIVVACDMVLNRKKRTAHRHENIVRETAPWSRFVALGLLVGCVSSLFGIGGGVIVVPSLLYFSALPAHMISATSHFAIFLTSPVGLATHWWQNDIRWDFVLPLALGGVIGGPIGARLSLRLGQTRLMLLVAAALVIAAFALILRHFTLF